MSFGVWMLVIAGLCLLCLWHRYARKLSSSIEKSGYRTWATVKSYRKEYVRVAGSWAWLDYPYVVYENAEGEVVFERLKYAESNKRLLEIGDEVEVIRHNGILYYRAALHSNYEWSHLLWIVATIGALLAMGSLASYFTNNR